MGSLSWTCAEPFSEIAAPIDFRWFQEPPDNTKVANGGISALMEDQSAVESLADSMVIAV